MAANEERRGVRVPPELHAVAPRPLEEYTRARIVQFAQAFAARLNPTVAPAVVQQAAHDCIAGLPPPDYAGISLEQRDLQLVFRHDCLSLGCLDAQCVLCEHNPHRRCSVNFAPKYLVNDVLKAKCDAPIRVELIDRSTGQPILEDLPDIMLEMCVLDGNAYDAKVSEAGEERDDDLEACALLLNNKAQALLQAGPGATHNANSKVQVPLAKGVAVLPDLHVSDSSEAMLSGRKPPFRLLVKAVHLRGQPISVRHAVSEGFVVATRRTRTAGKVEIPNVDDHISKLEHMGKETVKKLQDIRGSGVGVGIDIAVPDNCINKVGEFRKLALLAEADGHLRQKLQQVLKLSKEKWEEARDHAMRAVVADNRMRIWYADKANMEVGLLFTCRLGDVDLDRPVGLLTKKAQEGAQTTMEATLMAQQTPAQREQVRQLQPQAVAAWWQQGHPGWAIYPVDSEQFLTTGALDSVSLPMPTEPPTGPPPSAFAPAAVTAPTTGAVPPPAGLPPSAAFNPALASAFMGAAGAAGGANHDALLRAMSPFLHGANLGGQPASAFAPAAAQPHGGLMPPPGTGAAATPFAAANNLMPPPASKPGDAALGGGVPGGPPLPGASFNLANLGSLLGGDLSRLPQLAGLANFPSLPPGMMSGDLETLLAQSSFLGPDAGTSLLGGRAPSFNIAKLESLNLPDEMMAAVLQMERAAGGAGASLPHRQHSAAAAALAVAAAAARQEDLQARQGAPAAGNGAPQLANGEGGRRESGGVDDSAAGGGDGRLTPAKRKQ